MDQFSVIANQRWGLEGRILWAWGKGNKVTLDGKWGEGREEETIG